MMKEQIKTWLKEGRVDGFLAYRLVDGHPLPHLFRAEYLEELEDLATGPARYPLETFARDILDADPSFRLGILARDCNQRALRVLAVWNQIPSGQVIPLAVNCCPSNLKDHADCSYLERVETGETKKRNGIDNHARVRDMESIPDGERIQRWLYEFQKCIKCYGCRNICPVCFCRECSLEHDDLVETGMVPPEVPIFHLVRAVHMAGRCIDCGLCEDACPMNIPLRLLYRGVNEIVRTQFDYTTGESEMQSPFNILGDVVELVPEAS